MNQTINAHGADRLDGVLVAHAEIEGAPVVINDRTPRRFGVELP